MEQFCFKAFALQLVLESLGGESAHPLQIECPARSRTEIVESAYEGNNVHAETPSGVELCPEEGPPLM